MKRLLFILCFLLPLTFAFGEGQPVGNKMKQDPDMQEKALDPGNEFPFAVGDTIVISRKQTHYLTGEKIANWVYYVMHVIKQVGGKRFPKGILVDGILSWVHPDEGELLIVAPVDRGDSVQNALVRERLYHDSEAVQKQLAELARLDSIERHRIDSMAAAQLLEQARRDSFARAQADSLRFLARQKEVADSLARADSLAKAQADSLMRLGRQHRLSIGLRGGVASLMQQTDHNIMDHWKAGYDALLDLQYAYYFGAPQGKVCNMGLITGLSLGYSRSPISSGVDTTYSVVDKDGEPIQYSVSAGNVTERDAQLQLEIPLLFSLRHRSGAFFNVGPKLVAPVFSHYQQHISQDADISANFTELGVVVTNEVVTGKLQEQHYKSGDKVKNANIHVLLTTELGYEFYLKNGGVLGLGAYADYSFWNNYKNTTDNASLIHVGLPQAGGADVNVFSALDTYGTSLGFFDCGLKLIYHFTLFPKK